MAAATIVFSKIGRFNAEPIGNHRERIVTLTVTFSTSTYLDGGLADATNFPAGWQKKFDMNTVDFIEPVGVPGIRLATFESMYPFEFDLTNRKIILYGGATTAAEDVGFQEIPNAAALVDGAHIATVRLIGT